MTFAEIRERLAHPHQHHVGDDTLATRLETELFLREPHLPDDSAAVRLRLKPCWAVEQKEQSRMQPTWEEMHSVPRSFSGMNTISKACDESARNIHFRRPVGRTLLGDDFRGTDFRALVELRAKVLRQIRHVGDLTLAALVDPVHHLAGAEGLAASSATNASSSARGKPNRLVRLVEGGRHGGAGAAISRAGAYSVVRKKYAISVARCRPHPSRAPTFCSMLKA